VGKLRKELEAEKLEHAQLKGQYYAKTEELDRLKAKLEVSNKELLELKVQAQRFAGSAGSLEELEQAKKELIVLKAECAALKKSADLHVGALEQLAILQKEHEMLVKQLADIKSASFEAERATLRKGDKGSSETPLTKVNVIDELRGLLAEVVYVYRTLDTNAKELKMIYSEKKEKIEGYANAVTAFEQSKRKEEKLKIIQELAPTLGFLNAIPSKPENAKLISQCLAETIKVKSAKLETYNDQIAKFDRMLTVAAQKIPEYEQKLTLYY
jgi:hypothetical protein